MNKNYEQEAEIMNKNENTELECYYKATRSSTRIARRISRRRTRTKKTRTRTRTS
jgi:hypothetical protein